MAAPIRVVVADDDPIVCTSLETILNAEDDIAVVGLAHCGEQAVEAYGRLRPDILLADIRMPGGTGLEAARRILAEDPAARVVFLTTFSDDEYIVGSLQVGARGYLIKQDIAAIAPALRAVMAGQRVLEGEVMTRMGERALGSAPPEEGVGEPGAFEALTGRERDVLRGVAQGLDNAQIADELSLSEGTVRNHISSMLAKLSLRNRTQLAVYYYRGRL